MAKDFRSTEVFREFYTLFLEYDENLKPKYNLSEITKIIKEKFKDNPKYDKLNVSTIKRWVDRYELNKTRENVALHGAEQVVKERMIIEEKLEAINSVHTEDIKQKYKSLDTIFQQSQFLLNRVLQIKIKRLEEFLQDDRDVTEVMQFMRGLNLSEKELSIVNAKAFECLQRLNPDNDVKKAFDNFYESFNNSFGKI